tara:strand:- start:368 stop:697 length:330 start_codon:yes stop_codon:yes gene_type:complete
MSNINEEKIVPLEIDLNPKTMDESYLAALGGQIKTLLQMMFGGSILPTSIRGTQGQVSAFARAIGNEKKYLQTIERYGLTNKRTLANRHTLEKAIAGFEKETGIKWPFK